MPNKLNNASGLLVRNTEHQAVTNCIWQAGVLAVWQVRPRAHFPTGLTGFLFEIPPDHIQVTVGNKCKKTDDQTDTIVINNNERKDLAFWQDSANLMEIYFVFFFPPQKKKKETPPTLQHICKPHEPTLKTKACKRAAILLTHPC